MDSSKFDGLNFTGSQLSFGRRNLKCPAWSHVMGWPSGNSKLAGKTRWAPVFARGLSLHARKVARFDTLSIGLS